MKVSLEWLSDYVSFPRNVDEVSEKLTMLGLNVDDVEKFGVEGKILVGLIEKVSVHPKTPKLLVCDVNVGSDVLKVITGDLSVKEGQMVPVALSGSKLADGRVIEKVEIKGVVSEAMMCSLKELGVEEQSSGIHVFEGGVEIGQDVVKLLRLDDVILNVEITPNRGDCLSYIGIARELAVAYKEDLRLPSAEVKSDSTETSDVVEIEIEDVEGCPRYAAVVIRGVEVKESPVWLKRRLMASGIRPLNNVVDATNYVMLETGHPIHAFDYNLVKSKKIVVRKARKGERVVLLDGKEYKLLGGETLITDGGETIIAVGGVMGAENSGIRENTRDVLVEVAYFDPVRIRKTRKGLNINTDASYRFERGVDPEDVEFVMKRVVSLIQELAGGVATSGILDVYPHRIETPKVLLRKAKISYVLGMEIPENDVEDILNRLGFDLERTDTGWMVSVPSYRIHDVKREIDLIEEIGRVYGYDSLKSERTLIRSGYGGLNEHQRFRRKVVELMKGFGFDEIITFSFTSSNLVERFKFKDLTTLKLLNPITEEMDVMRESLIYTIFQSVSYNYTHQRRNVKVFEIGKIYWREGEEFKEREVLGAVAVGLENEKDYTDRRKVDFLTFKGVVDELFNRFGIEPSYVEASYKGFVPTRCAEISVGSEVLGFLGMVDPEIASMFEIKDDVYYFELDLELLDELRSPKPTYRPSPVFPSIRRDVSFLLKRGVRSAEILEYFKEAGGDLVEEVGVSDVYRGEGIPEGTISVTFYVVFRSGERTLTDDEVNELFDKMVEGAEREFGVSRRYGS